MTLLPTLLLAYPEIDPVIVQIGPFALRWYGLAYLAGILGGWWYMRFLATHPAGAKPAVKREQVGDFVAWATVGIVLGGRLGYVLFYKPAHFLAHPLEIFQVWQGGMSFHGGLLGVVVAVIWFCRANGIPLLAFGDLMACAAPIGLFFGRVANFVNGELFGRPAADVPWAMVFPHGGPEPRHPSQLYEAGLEGLLLFVVLHLSWRVKAVRARPGTLTGIFLIGYAMARATVETYREPDTFLGFLWGGLTMGQLLSLPMLAVGVALLVAAWKRP